MKLVIYCLCHIYSITTEYSGYLKGDMVSVPYSLSSLSIKPASYKAFPSNIDSCFLYDMEYKRKA